jgi:uncharacterized protein YbjT (DUF2867 family)
MGNTKIIAVLGATGAQGGGLVKSILEDSSSQFTVRALTRDASSDKAKALSDMGADVVEVDIDNYDSLVKAFTGAYGVYAVTFFWEHFSPEKEIAQVESIAKAAKETEIQHLVWSTLEDTRKWVSLDDQSIPTLNEKYKVPHFDGKGEADQYFAKYNVPTTYLLTSFYWDNLIYFGMGPKKGEDGNLTFALPMGDKPLPGIAAEDIGKCAYGIFNSGNEFIGKRIGIVGESITGQGMADALADALGKPVNYFPVPFDMYRGFDFPGADDLGNMFQVKHDYNDEFVSARSIELSKSLNPSLLNFSGWLAKYKNKIPLN